MLEIKVDMHWQCKKQRLTKNENMKIEAKAAHIVQL
ncbi:hypothetical protein Deipe_1145 [Deinococcus peraridilitoris DSM 19664]|uniref:Uncharacterized protein n=1 Tax=Deinococcus peraridilitoris (strain DSM 19664 / LMG 22246 / CIP 109416 / KR-200) TaxID=937777 RepID=K9ZZT2_DEIPD|nr:hypothetical protein Deipe_1145 [Deinococcus peraridilitoris DSM 19664]